MASTSHAFLVLLFLAAIALSFSNAEPQKNDKVEKNGDQVVEPTTYFHKKDPFHKKHFFHKKHPFLKKHPLPPIPVVNPLPPIPVVHPLPPFSIPVIKKKPITIPKFTVPKPVYVHPKFTIPKKPCPPIYNKPLFPPHPALP